MSTTITASAVLATSLLVLLTDPADDEMPLPDAGLLRLLLSLGESISLVDLSPRRFIALCFSHADGDIDDAADWAQKLCGALDTGGRGDAADAFIARLEASLVARAPGVDPHLAARRPNSSADTEAAWSDMHPLPAGVRFASASAAGVLVRHTLLAARSRLFEGETELRSAVNLATDAATWAVETIEALEDFPPPDWRDAVLRAGCADEFVGEAASGIGRDPCPLSSPAAQRHRLEGALARGDYTAALAALHAYFDLAYGTSLGGGSALGGPTTAQALLSPSLLADTGLFVGPLSRARELLLAASTGPPVGGTPLGRPLAHYPLLHLAALELWFGHAGAAGDALRECSRVAAANGDAACGSYCLELLIEAEAAEAGRVETWGSGTGAFSAGAAALAAAPRPAVSVVDPAAAIEALLRLRSRAGEMGLWRQQASIALRLAELRWGAQGGPRVDRASSQSASPASWLGSLAGLSRTARRAALGEPPASSASRVPPPALASLPDWLSFDPSVSFRLGGHGIGVAGVNPPSQIGPLPWPLPQGAAAAAATAIAGAISAVREGTRQTALASPLQALLLAHARRVKAVTDSGGARGAAVPTQQTPATVLAAVAGLPAPHSPAYWSSPASLSPAEAAALHAAAHTSSARMWEAAAEHDALPTTALRHAADVCAGVALAAGSWRVPAAGHSTSRVPASILTAGAVIPSVPDFSRVLDALCQDDGSPALERAGGGADHASSEPRIPPCPLLRDLPRVPSDVAAEAFRIAADLGSIDLALTASLPCAWPAAAWASSVEAGAVMALLGSPASVVTALARLADGCTPGDASRACLSDALGLLGLSLPAVSPVVSRATSASWEVQFATALFGFCGSVGADAPVAAAAVILLARAAAGMGRAALADELLSWVEARTAALSAPSGHAGSASSIAAGGTAFVPPRLQALLDTSRQCSNDRRTEDAIETVDGPSDSDNLWRGVDRDSLALFAQCFGDGGAVRGWGRGASLAALVIEARMARAGALLLEGSGSAGKSAAKVRLCKDVVPLLDAAGASTAAAVVAVGSVAVAAAQARRAAAALAGL